MAAGKIGECVATDPQKVLWFYTHLGQWEFIILMTTKPVKPAFYTGHLAVMATLRSSHAHELPPTHPIARTQ